MGKRGPDPGSLVQFPQQSKELASLRAENERLRGRVEKMAADVDRCVHAYRGPSSSFESAKLETYTDIQTRLRSLLSVPDTESATRKHCKAGIESSPDLVAMSRGDAAMLLDPGQYPRPDVRAARDRLRRTLASRGLLAAVDGPSPDTVTVGREDVRKMTQFVVHLPGCTPPVCDCAAGRLRSALASPAPDFEGGEQ